MTDEQKQEISVLRRSGMSFAKIGAAVGLSKDTVKSYCRRCGSAEKKPVTMPQEDGSVCRQCGRKLVQTKGKKHRVFCSDQCRETWWHEHPERIQKKAVYQITCAGCGRTFTSYGNRNRKYCSHDCYISTRFKGGERHE